jgi:hypothetical protein
MGGSDLAHTSIAIRRAARIMSSSSLSSAVTATFLDGLELSESGGSDIESDGNWPLVGRRRAGVGSSEGKKSRLARFENQWGI